MDQILILNQLFYKSTHGVVMVILHIFSPDGISVAELQTPK